MFVDFIHISAAVKYLWILHLLPTYISIFKAVWNVNRYRLCNKPSSIVLFTNQPWYIVVNNVTYFIIFTSGVFSSGHTANYSISAKMAPSPLKEMKWACLMPFIFSIYSFPVFFFSQKCDIKDVNFLYISLPSATFSILICLCSLHWFVILSSSRYFTLSAGFLYTPTVFASER